MSSRLVRLPTMLSARTVAARLGKSRAWVYERCEDGTFAGAYRDGSWRIPEPCVFAYVAARRSGAEKPSCAGCGVCPVKREPSTCP